MFGMGKKQHVHTSVYLNDTSVKYLTLSEDSEGFFVLTHDTAMLPEGIISQGEVLRPQALGDIVGVVKKNIEKVLPHTVNHTYSLLLNNEYFSHVHFSFPEYNEEKPLMKQVTRVLKENKEEYPWIETHHFVPSYDPHTKMVHIETLAPSYSEGYKESFTKAGIPEVVMYSESSSCASLLKHEEYASILFFGAPQTRYVSYRKGVLSSEQVFDYSPKQLIAEVKKTLRVTLEQAMDIITTYGVSRAHKDEKVYNQLMRSLTPLTVFLRKKSITKEAPLFVWFLTPPLPGFLDHLQKHLGASVTEIDIVKRGGFHDILSLKRNESYAYSLLITHCQAMMLKNHN